MELSVFINFSGDSKSKSGVEKFKTRVIVNNDGSIAWFSPALYITTCSIWTFRTSHSINKHVK